MGDDEDRAPLHQLRQRLLDQELALRVEIGRGLVQDEDGRILEEGAGDGQALPLAAGEPDAALADLGPIAVGERRDEVVGLGQAAGVLDLGARGPGPAVGDVVLDETCGTSAASVPSATEVGSGDDRLSCPLARRVCGAG
jgi:hypothetical protein